MALIKHFILVHSVFKYAGRFVSVSGLEEAVELTKLNRIKSEIIGHWLYCFTNHLIGVQLLAIGFWYTAGRLTSRPYILPLSARPEGTDSSNILLMFTQDAIKTVWQTMKPWTK